MIWWPQQIGQRQLMRGTLYVLQGVLWNFRKLQFWKVHSTFFCSLLVENQLFDEMPLVINRTEIRSSLKYRVTPSTHLDSRGERESIYSIQDQYTVTKASSRHCLVLEPLHPKSN